MRECYSTEIQRRRIFSSRTAFPDSRDEILGIFLDERSRERASECGRGGSLETLVPSGSYIGYWNPRRAFRLDRKREWYIILFSRFLKWIVASSEHGIVHVCLKFSILYDEATSKGLSLSFSSFFFFFFFFRIIIFLGDSFQFRRLDSLTGINSRGINSISRVGRRSRHREFVRWLG